MAAKTMFILCAQALFIQAAFGLYIGPKASVTGNSVVENDIYVGNSGYSSGAGLGLGLATSGLANAGFGSSGILTSGIGSSGIITSGIGSSGLIGSGFGSAGLIGANGLNIQSSGPLLVTAISPIGPTGLAVASENIIEGNLLVSGQLPFLSAVAFDGTLPTAGSGVATCGCGSGSVGIVSEGLGRGGLFY